MRAALMHEAGAVRVGRPTDALVRTTAACVRGRGLHPYRTMPGSDGPIRMGHPAARAASGLVNAVRAIGSALTLSILTAVAATVSTDTPPPASRPAQARR